MKLERCLDCEESKTILIERYYFGKPQHLCYDCYNVRFGHNYFLKIEKREAEVIWIPSFLKH